VHRQRMLPRVIMHFRHHDISLPHSPDVFACSLPDDMRFVGLAV
jgi:hypothetical protein